jgi:hypothetical protein
MQTDDPQRSCCAGKNCVILTKLSSSLIVAYLRRRETHTTGGNPMRPPTDDRATKILLDNLPEFESRFLDLSDLYGEDLTPQVVFNELAEYTTDMLADDEDAGALERVCTALELVALEPGADGTDMVAFCFFDQLPLFALEVVRSYLQPVTATILELVDQDLLYEDDGETTMFSFDHTFSSQTAAPVED